MSDVGPSLPSGNDDYVGPSAPSSSSSNASKAVVEDPKVLKQAKALESLRKKVGVSSQVCLLSGTDLHVFVCSFFSRILRSFVSVAVC